MTELEIKIVDREGNVLVQKKESDEVHVVYVYMKD